MFRHRLQGKIAFLLLLWLLVLSCTGNKPQTEHPVEKTSEHSAEPRPEARAEKSTDGRPHDVHEKGTDGLQPHEGAFREGLDGGEKGGEQGGKEDVPEHKGTQLTLPKEGGRVCFEHVCVEASQKTVDGKPAGVTLKHVNNAPLGSVWPPMDIGPDNWKPADKFYIIFTTKGLQLPAGTKPEQLRVAFVENNRWRSVPSIYDAQKQEVRGETTHFSIWGLVLSSYICQVDGECLWSQNCVQKICEDKCTSDVDCKKAGETCNAGKCTPCQPGFEVCDGKDNDCDGKIDENCRTCGSCLVWESCGGGGFCQSTCGTGTAACGGGRCTTDLRTDDHNCGDCGIICPLTEKCVNGNCTQ